MTQKIERTLDDYLDRCFVYSILLNKSYSYYSRLRTLFKIPIILTSSVMSLVNSNLGDDNILKIVNITFNILTALVLSLGSTLKIEEKAQVFLSSEKKFLKLTSVIEQKIISEDAVNIEFVNGIMNTYDAIIDQLDYDIPKFICTAVRKEYATKKTLPLIINGIPKEEIHRSPRICTFDGLDITKRKLSQMGSSILFDDNIRKNSFGKLESHYEKVFIPSKLPNLPKVLNTIPLEIAGEDENV